MEIQNNLLAAEDPQGRGIEHKIRRGSKSQRMYGREKGLPTLAQIIYDFQRI
jgi:hypothetical protein